MNQTFRLTPILLLLACGASASDADTEAPSSHAMVDSVLPMDVALERFRKDLPQPEGLHGGVTSLDTLVRLVIDALESSDTLAFERLAVNRAEWAWLFYPTNILAQAPYELPPGLAWFQRQEASRKGVFRALREYGSRRLGHQGYRCDPEPTKEAENSIWTNCTVTLSRDDEAPKAVRLFGAVLERGGHFAILSYDNDF